MSDRPQEGTAAAAVGAHSKDAMQPTSAAGGGGPAGVEGSAARSGEALGETVQRVSGDAAAAAGQAGDAAVRMARTAGQELSRAGGQAYAQGAQAGRQAGRYVGGLVRSDPLLALLAAGAAGLALGLLIGRR